MTEEKKDAPQGDETTEKEEKPTQGGSDKAEKPEVSDTKEERKEEQPAEKAEEVKEEPKVEEKTALEEVTTEAEEKKGKKGKSEYVEVDADSIRTGMIVRVHQKIVDTNPKGEEKERIQVFQGMVLSHKHGNEAGASITVRKVSGGIGVEKIFPLHMPAIEKIEMVRKYKVRQSRPNYLRTTKKRLREIKD